MQHAVLGTTHAETRRRRIVEHIRGCGFGSVGELSQMLGVSEMTIRRDLQVLAGRHLVRQVHGGANALVDAGEGIDFRLRASRGAAAKQAIASAALQYVTQRATLAIDSGTTTLELARQLPSDEGLLVVTHSLPALQVLARSEGIEVVSLSGALQRHTQSFAGPMTVSVIHTLRVDTFFLAASSVREGFMYVGNSFDAQIKLAFMDVSDRIVLLVDSSKFSSTALFPVAPVDRVTAVITDPSAPVEAVHDLQARGIAVQLTSALTALDSPPTIDDPRQNDSTGSETLKKAPE